MTSGRRPELLAGILASLRGIADEVVVAVEEPRGRNVHAAVADMADAVLVFPQTSPADRPIAWLFGSCSGTWIFNIDDDEVPSPRLLAALPEVVGREDITHAWVAGRWPIRLRRAIHRPPVGHGVPAAPRPRRRAVLAVLGRIPPTGRLPRAEHVC